MSTSSTERLKMGRVAVFVLALLSPMILLASSKTECDWPSGMVFVGLKEDAWQVFKVRDGGKSPVSVDLKTEARNPVMSKDGGSLYYIDDKSDVMKYSFSDNTITTQLASADTKKYSQIELRDNSLCYVLLENGQSINTDIYCQDIISGDITHLIQQRSAQFDPFYKNPWFYYSSVHCVLGCGKIIQEIWRYNTESEEAEQLTLMNSISRSPVIGDNTDWLYFSSNKTGQYHIYKQSLYDVTDVIQLTEGNVSDILPAMYGQNLYFIRKNFNQDNIACLNSKDEIYLLKLPKDVVRIRDMSIQ